MAHTSRLELPLLAASQAQKHVTHNEALLALDALTHLAVTDRRATPPAAPVEGSRHLVEAGASGAFAGQAGKIAVFEDNGWRFLTPRQGWLAWVAQDQAPLVHDGSGWTELKVRSSDRLGIGATADATNRLAVASPAALFTHAGSDSRVTINKAAAGNTASLLFQTGYSGRAEIGLAGSDNVSVKVSSDGATWRQPLTVKRDTGFVGIGTPDPGAPLTVDSSTNSLPAGNGSLLIQGDANKERLDIRSAGVAPGAGIQGFGARGTLASPQAPLSGDRLMALLGSGWDGTQFVIPLPAQIDMVADGDWSSSANGTAVIIRTTPPGQTVAARADRMKITGDGRVGVGTATPQALLDVAGTMRVGQYGKAALPSASGVGAGGLVYVSDEVGGGVLAFSDGVAWRRVTDRAIVS
ncbi:DUF2793 domain-containing protein [Bosea caraganae]|nr:DUF2793 domain-containing protein [Bosea caraganae]